MHVRWRSRKPVKPNHQPWRLYLVSDDNSVEEFAKVSRTILLFLPTTIAPDKCWFRVPSEGVDQACELLKEKGAKRALKLPVEVHFTHHSCNLPARSPAAVDAAVVSQPYVRCIKMSMHILKPIPSPSNKTSLHSSQHLYGGHKRLKIITDGALEFVRTGPGDVLKGLIKKVNSEVTVG